MWQGARGLGYQDLPLYLIVRTPLTTTHASQPRFSEIWNSYWQVRTVLNFYLTLSDQTYRLY